MAILSDGDTIKIFKFKETGALALCAEVVDYFSRGEFHRDNILPESGRLGMDEQTMWVEFDRA